MKNDVINFRIASLFDFELKANKGGPGNLK